MNAQNFALKADWIERIDKLNPEQRKLTVMAVYDYMVYGKLSDNVYVNFAISWIRDEIDRMKQARERREARKEEKRRAAEELKKASEEQAQVAESVEPESEDIPATDIFPATDTGPASDAAECQSRPQAPATVSHQVPKPTGQYVKIPPRRNKTLTFREFKRASRHRA